MSDGGAASAEAERQRKIREGESNLDQKFAGFNTDFYNQRTQDYVKAATPDVMKDYRETKNNLTYSLARAGLLKSSSANQRDASLQSKLASNESQIANNAQDWTNRLKADVQTQKGNLTSQLVAGGDPTAVNAQALGATASLRADSPIQPLGNLFQEWSSQYLGNKMSQANGDSNIWNSLNSQNFGTPNAAGGSSTWTN